MNRVLAALTVSLLLSACGRQLSSDRLSRSDRNRILQAVIHDVLTNPELQRWITSFGKPGDRRLALVSSSGSGIQWPTNFDARVTGYEVVFLENRDLSKPSMLGIRIDRFDLSVKPRQGRDMLGFGDVPVVVTLLNAGGSGREGVVDGRSRAVYYRVKRTGKNWVVQYAGGIS